MQPQQKQAIRQRFNELIVTIQADIAQLEIDCQPIEPDSSLGRITRMDAMVAQRITKELLRKRRQRLIQLKRGLSRIDSPDFGLCSMCEEPITPKRLMMYPERNACVECING